MANPNNEEKIDYISRLPDAILSVILSFLPTKSAVGTARLSKRWKYVWTKVPVIDFTELLHIHVIPTLREERKIYNDFLNRTVLQNDVSCLERFAIKFYIIDDESLDAINSLLDVIKWRQFCELNINLIGDLVPLPLPKEFLSSQRLVVLKLDGLCIDDSQMSFHLPNLETVHFGNNIVFPSDEFLRRFLLGCLVLKNLYIRGGCGLGHIYVESSTLMSLEIRSLVGRNNDELALCITIKASNLRYLILQRAHAHYDIDDLNLLTYANIALSTYPTSDGIVDNSVKLIQKVSGATTLRLVISNLNRYVDKLPKFENLTQLNFSNDGCAYELLKRAPKLKSLIFDNVGLGLRLVNKFWDSEVVPECLSCLEKVELFWLEEADTKVAEYFLKTGTALKDMIVNVQQDCKSGGVSIERCRALRQMLLDCPTLSSVCKVKVLLYDHRSCIVIA